MRVPNPELGRKIRAEGLALLMEKEPEEIGMRDIACRCGVSATSIYYYYSDKGALFEEIKLECLSAMYEYIRSQTAGASSTVGRLRQGLTAFRDWAFGNPRIALLVMGRLKPNLTASHEELAQYYQSNNFAEELLDVAVAEGISQVNDTRLASSLCIAAVWGAVESVLLNRTHPDYWDKGIFFTDRMIEMLISEVTVKGSEK